MFSSSKYPQFQGFNIDKTGYTELKMGTLKKIIALCSGVHGGVSIGPCSPTDSNVDEVDSEYFLSPGVYDRCSTPVAPCVERRNQIRKNQIPKTMLDQSDTTEQKTEVDEDEISCMGQYSTLNSSDSVSTCSINNQNVVEVMKKMEEFEKARELARNIRMDKAKEVAGKLFILDYLKTVTEEFGLENEEGNGRETLEQKLAEECNREEENCKIEELLTDESKKGGMNETAEEVAIKAENDNKEALIRRQEMAMKEEMAKREEFARLEEIARIEQAKKEELIRKQKLAEEVARKEEEAKQKEREKVHALRVLYDSIYTKEKEFSGYYQEFVKIVTGCTSYDLMKTCQADIQKANDANCEMLKIIDKCKVGDLQEMDLTMSVNCCNLISSTVKRLQEEIAKINESQPIEINSTEHEESHPIKEIKAVVSDMSREGIFLDHFNSLLDNLIKTETSFVDFLKDETLKKFRADCRVAVNTPVNAISPTSASHMLDKFNRLSNLLRGNTVTVKERRFSASQHPLGITYCTALLSEKIVKQGEQVVSSKPDSAFAIAAIVLALWNEFPDFGDLLLANFYRTCPCLMPISWEQLPDETDEEYSRKLGYIYVNNEKEDMNMFLKRMSGVTRLYCALMITFVRRSSTSPKKPLPIGPWEGWRWCASFINQEPKEGLSATLLLDMIEVTGHTMLRKYHHQFQKLLHLICSIYIPKIEQVTSDRHKGPVSRLKNFLETVIYSNDVPPPKGVLPANFW